MEQNTNIINALNTYEELGKAVLANYIKVSDIVKAVKAEELSRIPLHINVISISAVGRLKETAHSAILQHLLLNQTILTSFLKNIVGIDNLNVRARNVRPAEQDRIDVSIYDDSLCLIIENKINNAQEQPGQIFRYVKSAISKGYAPKQIKVLYLNSNHHYPPTDYSLTEEGKGENRIPDGIELIVRDYYGDIYRWIKGLPEIIPKSESYLQSALCQYQDYLEEHFYITYKFNQMKERIRFTINSEILKGISDENDADFSKRLAILEDAMADLQDLSDGIMTIKHELSMQKNAYNIQKELAEDGLSLIYLKEYGYHEDDNYGVRISMNGKYGFLTYGYSSKEKKYYIGFAFNTSNLTETEKECMLRLFKRFGKENSGEEDFFPCWCWIETSLLNEYVNFVRFVKEQSKETNEHNISFI